LKKRTSKHENKRAYAELLEEEMGDIPRIDMGE
jgi:hypothetical protein